MRRDGSGVIRAEDHLYVAEDVRAEPVVNGFRAWLHLIAPHTYSRNLVVKHLPNLRRRIAEAELCGDSSTVVELRHLVARIEDERPELVELGQALADLDRLLLDEADGFSLDRLYSRVPEVLRGAVELGYDRFNGPHARFLENALYRGPLYDTRLQAMVLRRVDPDLPGDGIPVPRLPGPDRAVVAAPFAAEVWDLVGMARRVGVRADLLAAGLGLTSDELAPFVTATPPVNVPIPVSRTVRARFFGHACVLIEDGPHNVLLDPLVAHRRPGTTDRFSFADLPERINCVAITHAHLDHLDHLDIETLVQIRHLVDTVVVPRSGAGELVDPSLMLALRALGFPDVRELDDFEDLPVPGGTVTAVPFFGEHADLTVRGKSGFSVALGGVTCVMVADSQCLEPRVYELVRDQIGPVAALFVGMECEGSPMNTATGPYLPADVHSTDMVESRRTKASDAEAALRLVMALRPAQAYVYAMGLEPWLSFMFGVLDPAKTYSLDQADLFISQCHARGIPAEMLTGARVLALADEAALHGAFAAHRSVR